MLIRHFVPGDAELMAAVQNAAAGRLPGYRPLTVEEARKRTTGPGFDPGAHFFAEEEQRVVGHAAFDPHTGQVSFPWCRPGCERLAHPLLSAVLREMARREIPKAFAAYRADWTDVWETLADHDFAKARDVVNYTQSIGDLPTMFQRPGLNITALTAADLPAVLEMAPAALRLSGPRLADYFLRNPRFAADAFFVLRRKDGGVKGVGLMVDDPALTPVEATDPSAAGFRFGSFGSEGLAAERVNGLFSFLAAPGKDAELIGQDLLWYATSRADTNSFDNLAAQAPSDQPHLTRFYDRYFQRQGGFPVYERDIGTESKF